MPDQPANAPANSPDLPDSNKAKNSLFVVGIGASAGGLSALEELFDHLPADSGAAFVVIQHLSPDFKSLMKELLERHTEMAVYRVIEGMELQPNSVYLIPPGKTLEVKSNLLRLQERKKDKNDKVELNFPIDIFLQSLAKNYGEQAIGVILSGSGSDGSRGLRAINEAGGISLVQKPSTAEFDGMPVSAIATGVVNQVLPIRELAQLIYQCIVAPLESPGSQSDQGNSIDNSNLQKISDILLDTEDLDFSHYKSSTVTRRIHRRRLINHAKSVDSYITLLNSSEEERKILCSDLLINVTYFFRNSQAWKNLEENILPSIIEQAKPGEELRFWVTACSTGEEAYSLAILVTEALEDFDKPLKAKIFATDIDRTALEKASTGIYPASIANDMSLERLQRHFMVKDDGYQVKRRIRETMIFSPQDLTKDAGFTRMHLISCRNVLIYMQQDLQYQVFRNLHFSLISQGILFLGEAETLGEFESEFKPLDKKWKIFQKRRDIRLPIPLRMGTKINVNKTSRFSANSLRSSVRSKSKNSVAKTLSMREEGFKRILADANSAALMVDRNNQLLHVCGNTTKIIQPLDGEIVTDVTQMVVLPLKLPLNTAIHRAKKEKVSVLYTGIKLQQEQEFYEVSLQVIPPDSEQEMGDFFLIKIDQKQVSQAEALPKEEEFEVGNEAQRKILELEHEIQQTRENLQALVEELETTNEEQQASNEELTASNEELQSTNEELHSVNEELHTVNIEYQSKIQELTELNNDIDNLLKSTNIGVIFLDQELRIRKFTPSATEAIALRESDIERPIEELSYKIECPNLTELLTKVIRTKQSIELEVKLKNKNSYLLMRIDPYQTEENETDGIVASFVKIDEIKKVQLELSHTIGEKNRQLAAIETASDGIAILNDDKFVYLNQAHLEIFGYSQPEELLGNSWRTLYEDDELARLEQEVFPVLEKDGRWRGEAQAKRADGAVFYEELTLSFTPGGDLICVCRDISEIKQARLRLVQANNELENRVSERTTSLANFSDRLRQLHRLATTRYEQIADLFADYILTGCDIFDLSTGIISQVENGVYKIIAVRSPLDLAIGLETTCQETYCAEVVEKRQTVAISHVGKSPEMRGHPVYRNLQLESYIGTPILVNGKLYGTLNFSSTKPRSVEFESYEREIIELMARDIGQSIAAIEAKKALVESTAYFQETFEQAAVGIAHVSIEGNFIKVNQKLCDILGYTIDRLTQLKFQDITYPEDLTIDQEYIPQVIAGEIDSCTYEKRYIHRDGSIVWANLTFNLSRLANDEPDYFIAVIEDIGDRKQTELALAASLKKLQQANEAKDSFIARTSHELRTPLNSILGFSRVLQDELQSEPAQLNSVKIIYQSSQHLLTLINDILDFSKLNAQELKLEPKVFDLLQFLSDITSIFKLRAQQKGLSFKTQISSSLATAVYADENRLRQVLFNLLSNAVKFTEQGGVNLQVGHVTDFVSSSSQAAEGTEIDPLNNLDTASASVPKIRFLVEDTGKGIPKTKFADIFDPFKQAENAGKNFEGTGLGLTISQDIVQLMGGEIKIASEVGQGAQFWFDITLSTAEAHLLNDLPPLTISTTVAEAKEFKILVVDDNANNRFLLVSYLEPLGFVIAEATNGQEGLEVARSFEPHAILADLAMPVMDGEEMIAQIKQESKLKKALIIAISANRQYIIDSSAAGEHYFLPKPVDLSQLLKLIKGHIAKTFKFKNLNKQSDQPDLLAPEQKELIKLLELADMGDMEAVERQVSSLESISSEYGAFMTEIKHFTANFQQQQLESFLRSFIHSSS